MSDPLSSSDVLARLPEHGLCGCGCGQKTRLAPKSRTELGWVRGQPLRFIDNHHARRPLAECFWEKVDRRGPDECWPWLGARNDHNYGTIKIRRRTNMATRVAWELQVGPVPKGLWLLHHCDNPPCVNARHLFLGTNADNMRDMISKGRSASQRRRRAAEDRGERRGT